MAARSTRETRLWVLLARKSDVALILRRGPSKQVLAIRWHRKDDTFYLGQWLKGRIYEHRCDLSPSGDLLLYFAASHKGPYRSWSALSRPPFLTALALWPKGDCWGGGGRFESEREFSLNHLPHQTSLAETFQLPKRFTVAPIQGTPGCVFDHDSSLTRDGWNLVEPGEFSGMLKMKSPRIWSKLQPKGGRVQLQLSFVKFAGTRDVRPVTVAAVVDAKSILLDLGPIDWVDWDRNGDLLHSNGGCIYRSKFRGNRLEEPVSLLDTAGYKFREHKPSKEAVTWNQPLRLQSLCEFSEI